MAEIGENLVGCCLRLIFGCEIVVYNQKIFRQGEVDVFGIDLDKNIIYICEVATHILGTGYGSGYEDTINKIKNKFETDIKYSLKILPAFKKVFMFWSPNVPRGVVKLLEDYKKNTEKEEINFDLIINQKYTEFVNDLTKRAEKDPRNTGEPFYRVLQILGHLKK
jgi:hypothetical protein